MEWCDICGLWDADDEEEEEDDAETEEEDEEPPLAELLDEYVGQMKERKSRRRRRDEVASQGCPTVCLACSLIAFLSILLFLSHFDVTSKYRTPTLSRSPSDAPGASTSQQEGWNIPVLSELRERDAALTRVANSWYTSAFDPGFYATLSHARTAPYRVKAGMLVAAAQFTGHGYVAGGLVLACLAATGQSPPDVWSATSFHNTPQMGQYPIPPYVSSNSFVNPHSHHSAPAPSAWDFMWM